MIPTTRRPLLLVGVLAASIGLLASDSGQPRPDDAAPPENPRSAHSEHLLGAHYYPWYTKPEGDTPAKPGATKHSARGWMAKALRGRLVPRQMPKLGAYDSRDPKVIAEHIRQSRRAGIDFWSVSWWGPKSREDVALREHILPHPDAAELRYAILYESTGRLGSFDRPDYSRWVADFEYLKKHYFGHPRYLKLKDRPVVFVYLTRVYFRDRGQEAMAELRKAVPEVYIVGDDVFGPRYRARHAELFDAVTAYERLRSIVQEPGGDAGGPRSPEVQLHERAEAGEECRNGVRSGDRAGVQRSSRPTGTRRPCTQARIRSSH